MPVQLPNPSLKLRVGEWVEVRTAGEILATLDGAQSLDHLPFMPEMLKYCGRKFRVYKCAHKTADTIEMFSIRRLTNTVHLEELRCDGAAHGGCQAGCLLFWKESWLKRADSDQPSAKKADDGDVPPTKGRDSSAAMGILNQGTRRLSDGGQAECYRCQATEMLKATTGVRRRKRFDPRFYVQDLTSGNVSLFDFVRFGALAALNAFLQRWFGFRFPLLRGLAGDKTPTQELNLQPGDLVRVKSKAEIERTLNGRLRNRGMNFDREMVPYCGKGPFRVQCRVEKLVNEKTGELVPLKNPCIILEGVTCSGNYLAQRMFSPRREYMFFREIWLERVAKSGKDAGAAD